MINALNDTVIAPNFDEFLSSAPNDMLAIYTVFHKTLDFGDKYVARAFLTNARGVHSTRFCVVGDTLEEVRGKIPEGLVCLCRQPEDDPVIVESWM